MQTLERIAEHIHLATGYDIDALRTKERDTFRVAARQLFCYYASMEGYTYEIVGSFVNRSGCAALHAAQKIKDIKETDAIIKNYIDKYEIMSKKKQVAEIYPSEYDNRDESTPYTGFSCPTCNGRGFHFDHGVRETRRTKCERCAGSGRLRAKVTIQWEADE